MDFSSGIGIAAREYQTDIGPADYVLFINKKAVGVIEAKYEDLAHTLPQWKDKQRDILKLKDLNNLNA